MAIYAIYIGKVSNLNDFILGTPILNRTTFLEKNTPGMFISTVPFKFCIQNDKTFVEFAQKISLDSLCLDIKNIHIKIFWNILERANQISLICMTF